MEYESGGGIVSNPVITKVIIVEIGVGSSLVIVVVRSSLVRGVMRIVQPCSKAQVQTKGHRRWEGQVLRP